MSAAGPLLDVRNLSVGFSTETGFVGVVDGVSFSLAAGETLALVGESGSGKTVTSLAVMGLLPRRTASAGGEVWMDGRDLLQATPGQMRRVRGRRIAMIFQEPMTSLNPIMSVGRQIIEAVELHTPLRRRQARQRAIELLDRVGIAAPERRVDAYPHELSGGMRQRVMIAIALACDPAVLIADEPTTALDVTIQAQILRLLADLQRQSGMAVLLITHDLAVVAETADRVAVMYAGRIVESAPVESLFARAAHPYTEGLMRCTPAMSRAVDRWPVIEGTVPPPEAMPPGCRFEPRCGLGRGKDRCMQEQPPTIAVGSDHDAACWEIEPQAVSAREP